MEMCIRDSNKVLLQRNSLLKQFAESRQRDEALLDIMDLQLVQPGNFVFEKRKEFLQQFIPMLQEFYGQIADQKETVQAQYVSSLQQTSFARLLQQNRERDGYLQRTSAGPHKDDLIFDLNGQPFKTIASQGQRKSCLLYTSRCV